MQRKGQQICRQVLAPNVTSSGYLCTARAKSSHMMHRDSLAMPTGAFVAILLVVWHADPDSILVVETRRRARRERGGDSKNIHAYL